MKLAENPFAAGKPVAARPAFVGRRAVVQTLVELLQAREHGLITISGPPGIGKTSFLRALRDELPDRGTYQAVYIDLSKRAKWPLAAAVRGVASTIARALGLGKPLLPGPSELVFRDTWLPATLGNLFSGGMGATLVLLIDNYKRPTDPQHAENIRAFASYLKQLIASTPRLLAVTTSDMFEPVNDPRAELLGTHILNLPPLDAEEAYSLIRTSHNAGTLRWKPRAAATVWALTRGHPGLGQRLCSEVWEELHYYDPAATHNATDADVTAAVDKAIAASRPMIRALWSTLPPLARVFLAALAEQQAPSGGILLKSLYQKLKESGARQLDDQLDGLPKALAEWGILELLPSAGFRLRFPLLSRVIARHYPLERVRAELDHAEPEAETHYRAALNLTHDLEQHPIDEVEEHLTRALELNPNHAGSIALLADIYTRRGREDDALALLERLYEIQPTAARPQIVELLLNRAQAETQSDSRLELLEEILKYAPNNREARQFVESTWQTRASEAEASGRTQDAIDAYTKAGQLDEAERVELAARQAEVEAKLDQIAALETARDYQLAREKLDALAQRFPDARDNWRSEHDRLVRLHDLNEGYEAGLAALRIGDYPRAHEHLSEVARAQPNFDEVQKALAQALERLKAAKSATSPKPPIQPEALPTPAKPAPLQDASGYAPAAVPGPENNGIWLLLALVVVIIAGVLLFGQGKPNPTQAPHDPVATPEPPQPDPSLAEQAIAATTTTGNKDAPTNLTGVVDLRGPEPALDDTHAQSLLRSQTTLQNLDPAGLNLAVSELVAHLFQPDDLHPIHRARLQLAQAEVLLTRALLIEFERSVRIRETVATSGARVTDDTLRALGLVAALGTGPLPDDLAQQRARIVVLASLLRGESPPAIEGQPVVQALSDAADVWRNPAGLALPQLNGLAQRLANLRGDPPKALPMVLEALTRYRIYRIEQTGATKKSARKLVLQLRRDNEQLTLLTALHRALTMPANPRNIGDVIRKIRLDLLSSCTIPSDVERPKITLKIEAAEGKAKLISVNPQVPELSEFDDCVRTYVDAVEYQAFTPTNPNNRRTLTL